MYVKPIYIKVHLHVLVMLQYLIGIIQVNKKKIVRGLGQYLPISLPPPTHPLFFKLSNLLEVARAWHERKKSE